jgi:Ca2+-binding EF-hand superfamily protein
MLMAFDHDGNAKLERAEVPERFQGLFDRADANKDSVLTRDELKQSATSSEATERGRGDGDGRGGRGGGRGPSDPLLSALDANGDRAVSAEEITSAPASLKRLDRNGDGSLTPDEFASSFGRRGGRGGDDAGAPR